MNWRRFVAVPGARLRVHQREGGLLRLGLCGVKARSLLHQSGLFLARLTRQPSLSKSTDLIIHNLGLFIPGLLIVLNEQR